MRTVVQSQKPTEQGVSSPPPPPPPQTTPKCLSEGSPLHSKKKKEPFSPLPLPCLGYQLSGESLHQRDDSPPKGNRSKPQMEGSPIPQGQGLDGLMTGNT